MTPILEARGLSKSFGELRAVDRVSFALAAGEVLALVGENGAGKTTLLNLLLGFYRPDEGEIALDGAPRRWRSPADAEARGLGMVHQHFTLVEPLTVAENVVLGREPRRFGLAGPFDRRRAEREVAEVAEREGLPIDPRGRVAELSVASRQRVEILKVLWRGARVVAFDEPTGALGPAESEALCETVRRLARGGRAVLFVSHKLREVLAVASRVAVLRAGRLVATLDAKGAEPERIARLMVGDASAPPTGLPRPSPGGAASPPPRSRGVDEIVLRLSDAACRDDRGAPALRGVSLALHTGEIVGVAGVDGNGQRELAEVLTGLRPLDAGRLEVEGVDLTFARARELRARGVAHVPEDRLRGGLFGALSVAENLALGSPGPLRRRRLVAEAAAAIRAYDIRPPEPGMRASALSGGNQQKLLLARELGRRPKLVVAVHPTRGLDLNAQALVRARLREAAAGGAAVLLVSFDLDELREIADRIVVLCAGRVTGEAAAREATDGRLGLLMSGAAA